jgi:hypothetical protein
MLASTLSMGAGAYLAAKSEAEVYEAEISRERAEVEENPEEEMKTWFAVMILSGALAGADAIAQEHKHEEHKEESKAPAQKGTDAAKADSKKCCDAMEKKADSKEGTAKKDEMKAKMEKMKEKMAEKMKETKGGAKTGEQEKESHQH